jgi:hypothetical protein
LSDQREEDSLNSNRSSVLDTDFASESSSSNIKWLDRQPKALATDSSKVETTSQQAQAEEAASSDLSSYNSDNTRQELDKANQNLLINICNEINELNK